MQIAASHQACGEEDLLFFEEAVLSPAGFCFGLFLYQLQACLNSILFRTPPEIVVGKITHRIEKCNVITKKGELDEEGCDENGVHWSFPEWDEMYDYQFVRIGEEHE